MMTVRYLASQANFNNFFYKLDRISLMGRQPIKRSVSLQDDTEKHG
jgi:hypothetical protein